MNIKTLFISFSLAILTTWAIQYFILNRYYGDNQSQEITSGQTFTAPTDAMQAKALNKEVDFLDLQSTIPASSTRIETPHAIYEFSNEAASLQQLTFKRVAQGQAVAMTTLESSGQFDKERRCFLVALDQQTPFMYQLIDQKNEPDQTVLIYRADTDRALIEKKFTVHHATFKVDLDLTITPKKDAVQPRILFPAPYLPAIKDDIVSTVYNTAQGSLYKEQRSKLDMNKGWMAPNFFGSDDRYFVHAMIADPTNFAKRAYYRLEGQKGLIAILEGPEIKEKTSWQLSFYFGPKEEEIMKAVDPRLEQTLDYSGMLSFISRFLLETLKLLNSYVHNYGWAIVLLTILINLVLLPINLRSNKGMKKYNEFQKKLAYIKQKYKHDPDTLAREQADLLSREGMPGLGGCLPKLLQIPIFFALSRVLSSSIELYKAPFLWMSDLSAKDPLYILPIAIVVGMIAQAPASDPKQRFTMIAIALVFGAIASNFAAGLSLYILVGVLLNGIQQWAQKKLGWA